jgi:DNA-binding IclR family transcriptional regulator
MEYSARFLVKRNIEARSARGNGDRRMEGRVMKNSSDKSLSLLEKQTLIVEAVAGSAAGLSFTEIRQAIDLPKATAHRLLGMLCHVDLLQVTADQRKLYQSGSRLQRLLQLTLSSDDVVPTARPVLEKLVKAFGETAFMTKLHGDRVETITMVTPIKEWQGHVHPGRVMPPHAAASAKAIFAFQPESMWRQILQPPLPRFTSKTLVAMEAIQREYARVRKSGIAICLEEIDPGQIGIAAPVHLKELGVIYSVCIAGPVERVTKHKADKIHGALKRAANEFAEALARRIENVRAS